MITDFLIKKYLRNEEEIIVFLGTKTQEGSLFAVVNLKSIWQKESLKNKFKSLITRKWRPNEDVIQERARDTFMSDIFGTATDYSDKLFNLMAWHNSQEWYLKDLTALDKAKSSGLDGMTVLTRLRYKETSKNLNLNLVNYTLPICLLAHPMVVKIPIVSFKYFLDIHSAFAFNSIRKSKHPNAEDLISYLYDILFIQQKIAISLHEYLRLIHYIEAKKQKALFITAEVNAITSADLVFSYLKASIEKMMIILGLTHGILNLDTKKTHKAKYSALISGIPNEVINLYYCKFVMEFIKSENIDELNSYRSGLLHKKGISDLQPHSYVGENPKEIPLKKIFQILHEQHSKNTAVLIGVLAIMTDELVKLDPPTISFSEIPK